MFKTIITFPNLSLKEASSKFKSIASLFHLPKQSAFIAFDKRFRIEIMSHTDGYTVFFERWENVPEIELEKIRNRAGLKNQLSKQLN